MRAQRLRPPLLSRSSWWLEEARAYRPEPVAPALAEPLDVDVAVVGGGYAGIWTALALLERDPRLRVAVLEAREVGHGPSGRNGGFFHGYWSSLTTLRAVVGDGAALQLAHASSAIVPTLRSARTGRRGRLAARGRTAQGRGDRGRGRARRALAAGGPRAGRRRGGGRAQSGRATGADRLAALPSRRRARPERLGTGWPLAGRQTTFASAVVLTEPVPDLLEQIGWTRSEAITDGRMFLHYFRTTPDGRVLMGSGAGRLEPGARVGPGVLDDVAAQARAHAGFRALLPALADARIEARWSGPIDVAADNLPRFGTVPGTRIHYGAGYSGNGVGPSWLGGQILASLALGSQDEWTALPLVGRRARRLPPEPFRYIGGRVVRWGTLTSEDAIGAGRRPSAAARAAAAIPRLLRMPIGTR